MKYLLLHTKGDSPQLYQLKTPGKFKIWAKETLEEHGFSPEHAKYYIILEFINTPILFKTTPNLKQKKNTYKAKVIPLSELNDIQ